MKSCLYLFVFIILLSSCAQVVSPGGGLVDKIPPRVISYSPDSAQLNFSSSKIEITFDEYVQLKDLSNQLIISPPLDKTPEMNVKSKTLSIDLENQVLKPNTTYSICFGNALQDVNENNPKENFRYVFSTGNYLDSLSLNGKVENAFDHKIQKGLLVMLYSDLSDSAAYKNQPDYFSKTMADGSFLIPNIKDGKYKIAVINDLNSNYRYDGEAENIGFHSELIEPSIKQDITIELFQEPLKKIYVKKYMHSQYGKIVVILNKGTDSIRISNLSNTDKGVQEFTEFSYSKDTLTYWVKNYQKDSLLLQINNGTTILDTLEFKMITKEEALKSKKNPLKLKLLDSPNGNQSFDLNRELNLVFSAPISSNVIINSSLFKEDTLAWKRKQKSFEYWINSEVITLCEWDSAVFTKDADRAGEHINTPTRNAQLSLKENTKYHLFIPPGTFTDIFGMVNDSIKIDFKTKEQKYYGSLKLNITLPKTSANYIVQLMDEAEHVIIQESITESREILYEYLHPMRYKLKVIYDANANNKWDTGNYLEKVQPEKVIYNSESIMIRSNWDADFDWKIKE